MTVTSNSTSSLAERNAGLISLGDLFFDFGAGSSAMRRNYQRMKSRSWIRSDKYYHCMGNCQATNYGPGGAIAAKFLSFLRSDILSRYFWEKDDWQDDVRANQCGQQGGSCDSICAPFVPLSSPGKPSFLGW